jgi:hypothetical protein
VDDRAGYYVAGSWDNFQRLLVNALYYDNRAEPMAFDSEQYGWHTRFFDAGALVTMGDGTAGPELLVQFLSGDTWMGNLAPALPKVSFDFRAAYLLVTTPFGRQRLSFRYDWFETIDRDEFAAVDNNDEEGFGVTLAYSVRTAEKHRLAFELIRLESDRLGRAFLGLPTETVEWSFQVSYRLAL